MRSLKFLYDGITSWRMYSQVLITHIKAQLMRMLLQQYHIKQLHQDAMVIDPRLKTKLLTAEEKEETLTALRFMMTEVPSHNDDTTGETSAPPAKKLKQSTEDNIFGELFNTTLSTEDQAEVEAYIISNQVC